MESSTESSVIQKTGEKNWQEQLRDWYKNQSEYSSIAAAARTVGLPRTTLKACLQEKRIGIPKEATRAKLYKLTGLELFKFPDIEKYLEGKVEETAKIKAPPYDQFLQRLSAVEEQLYGVKRELARQQPEAMERYDAEKNAKRVKGLLEELALSLEPFRTGSDEDRRMLVNNLKEIRETYAYVEQMIKIFEQGDDAKKWLSLTQPPHIVRRILGK